MKIMNLILFIIILLIRKKNKKKVQAGNKEMEFSPIIDLNPSSAKENNLNIDILHKNVHVARSFDLSTIFIF